MALILTCRAVTPSSLQRAATSCAASMAAYGDDSSRSALTFIPPVTLLMVSRPLESPSMLASSCHLCSRVKTRRGLRRCVCSNSTWSDEPDIRYVHEGVVLRISISSVFLHSLGRIHTKEA